MKVLKQSILALLLLCAAASCFTARAGEKREPLNVSSAVSRAQQLMLSGDPSGALKALDALGATGDSQSRVMLTRSMACTMLGDTQGALESSSRAVQLAPNDKNALYSQAVALISVGRESDAAPVLTHIKKIDPNYAPAYFYTGLIYNSHGKSDLARSEFEQALSNVTPADTWIKDYLAKNFPSVRAPASSAPAMSSALTRPGMDSTVPFADENNDSAAVSGSPELKKIKPPGYNPLSSTRVSRTSGYDEDAISDVTPSSGATGKITQSTRSQQPPGIFADTGSSKITQPAPQPSIANQQPLKSSGGPVSVYLPAGSQQVVTVNRPTFERARAKTMSGPAIIPDTVPEAYSAPSSTPSAPEEYKDKLRELYTAGRLEDAADFVRSYSEDHPLDVIVKMDLAALLTTTGNYSDALDAFSAADELSPDNAELLTNWGRCLELAGKTDEGIAKYREAVQADPKENAPRLNLGSALADAGRYDDAIAAYKDAISASPSYIPYYYGLLAALTANNKMEEAAKLLQNKFAAGPIDVSSLPQTSDKRYTLISLVLADPSATYNLAHALAQYGYDDDAATFYQLFAQTYPGKFSAAEQEAREFLQRHPAREAPR